jgi:hypothetical protein
MNGEFCGSLLIRGGQLFKFSNERVPQLKHERVYTFVYKTKDAIARSNEENITFRGRKLSLRDVGEDGVE